MTKKENNTRLFTKNVSEMKKHPVDVSIAKRRTKKACGFFDSEAKNKIIHTVIFFSERRDATFTNVKKK